MVTSLVALRARAAGLLGACVVVCVVAAGCASAVDGQGHLGIASSAVTGFPSQPVRSGTPSAGTPLPTLSAPVSATPTSTPASTPTPTSTTPAPPAVELTSLLEPRPAGAHGWSNAWGHTKQPTPRQFAKQFYPADSRAGVIATLRAEGLTGIAHQTWIATDASQIDIVLMRFGSSSGALHRYAAVTSGTASRSDVSAFNVGSYPHGEAAGFRESGQDSDGYVRARTYGRLNGSTIVVEAFFFSPGKFAKGDLVLWTDRQLARLA